MDIARYTVRELGKDGQMVSGLTEAEAVVLYAAIVGPIGVNRARVYRNDKVEMTVEVVGAKYNAETGSFEGGAHTLSPLYR